MPEYLDRLNPEQKRAVEATEGPVLVLSGAGTGKTSVLVARIAHILRQGLAQPWQILALTFTNKAANEMKSRVGMLVKHDSGLQSISDAWIGTFHSIGLRILRTNAERAGLRRDFLVFGEDEQKAVIKTVIAGLDLDAKDYPPAEWVEKIQKEKDKGLRESEGHASKIKNFDRIYSAYNSELARLNAVDFGDLILKVLELFVAAPDVLQKYQHQFKYVMVDEYQDTNASQEQMVRMLAAGGGNICCVGDDDQSIYSWRGAEIRNIIGFEKTFPDAKLIRLETNYRSTENILNAANSLIRRNTGRLGKELRSAPGVGAGEKVHVAALPTGWDEARLIADAVENEKRGTGRFSDFSILIRAGSLSRLFEEEFAGRGIPYKLVGATKFYDRMEIRDVIAYVRLLCYPFDDLSFLRVISKPRRGFGDAAIAKLRDNGEHFMAALRAAPLSGKQRESADGFLRAFDFDLSDVPPDQAAQRVLENSGYMRMWQESKEIDAPDRIANIKELLSNVISRYDTLQEFLEHAALMMTDDNDAEDNGANADAVGIMTIHAAKGLEFDTVFLPAWEEGIFPNEIAVGDGGLEEERRLAYVALTRARRRALISYSMSRMVFGQMVYNPPSRFIGEIDERFVQNANSLGARTCSPAAGKEIRKPKIAGYKTSMVGRLVSHPDLGGGVVIEDGGEILTVAFKDKGIKKVAARFLKQ